MLENSDLIHAVVIICVLASATVLCALHVVTDASAVSVLTAAVGYAAGRAGTS